jgi:hypothetical protein
MKKILLTLTLITIIITTNSFTPDDSDLMYVTDTLEDMKEWMQWDMQNGAVDTTVGKTYIMHIDNCISILYK